MWGRRRSGRWRAVSSGCAETRQELPENRYPTPCTAWGTGSQAAPDVFRRIRWKLLATYLIVVFPTLIFLGVHLTRQFETAYADQLEADLLELARVIAANAADRLSSGNPGARPAPPHAARRRAPG